MKKLSHSLMILFVFAVLLSAGCAGQKAAQGTARILVGQTTKLSSQIGTAIKAEETNYASAALILGRSANRQVGLLQDEAVIRSGQDFARAIMASESVSDADIRDLFEKFTRDAWSIRKDALARTAAETEALTANLTKLQAKTDALGTVRKGLEALQKEASVETQGQELYDWSKKVIDGVEKK